MHSIASQMNQKPQGTLCRAWHSVNCHTSAILFYLMVTRINYLFLKKVLHSINFNMPMGKHVTILEALNTLCNNLMHPNLAVSVENISVFMMTSMVSETAMIPFNFLCLLGLFCQVV